MTKKGDRRIARRISLFIFVGLSLALVIGCSEGMSDSDAAIDPGAVQEAVQFMGVELPDGADDVRVELTGALDPLLYIRMTLPDEVIEPYLMRLGFKDPLKPDPPFIKNYDEVQWWRPADLPSKLYGHTGNGTEQRDFTVVLENSDADRKTIYITAF